MKTLKVAIIGCGNIFPMHAQSIKVVENARLIAVCDIKENRAKRKAKQYNCSYYTDYKKMLEEEDVDVVHICLPHFLHAQVAIYAAKLGINIFTEKPMAIKLADAESMIKTAKDSKVTLGVIFQNRYNPGSQFIKNASQENLERY